MGLQSVLYNTLFKRTSTFALTIALGAFVFEAAIDETSKAIFNSINRGVSYICEL